MGYFTMDYFAVDEEDYDPDDDCRTHSIECDCEDCMQTYPERFFIDEDGTWENIHRVEK